MAQLRPGLVGAGEKGPDLRFLCYHCVYQCAFMWKFVDEDGDISASLSGVG